ncbi:MAG: LptA/OstA family protein [Desulfobacca sp.]|nr:LptA/OstA family protein [Desulfobacca sp.]
MSFLRKAMDSLKQPRRWIISGLILVLVLVLAEGGVAQETEAEYPLNITAARLEADHPRQEISFIGQVVARYKDMILYSDVLKIFYQTKEATSAAKAPAAAEKAQAHDGESPLDAVGIEKISRIEAQGHVRLVQEDKVATGDQAIYYKAEEKVVLLGHPQLWQGENTLKGEIITFYLKDNRAVVDSAPQKRVEAIVYPKTKTPAPGRAKP